MGPPETDPSWLILRYLTPNVHSTSFVDIPKNPAKNNQKAAPGPPIPIATATPPMLPMPTVPEIAVDTAWKCDISPSASSSL